MKWTSVHSSLLTLAACEALAAAVSIREQQYIEETGTVLPVITAGQPLIYFFGAVAAMGLALAFLPIAVLKFILKGLFLALYAWGVFVILVLSIPPILAGAIAVAGALAWLKWPRLWLHNLLLGLSLVGYGSVFGLLLSPGVALGIMAVISVYDLVSVRSGHMMWMVKKLSGVSVIPAFVFPKSGADWSMSMDDVKLDEEDERIVSLLGGGDVAFSLVLLVSVLAASGLGAATLMAAILLVGLISVFWFQRVFFKGGPTPAMPPITAVAALGYGAMMLFGAV